MISQLIASLKRRIETRRQYNKTLAEIAALTHSELVDMNADRNDLRHSLYRQVYG